jgi:hypothetical protein
MQIKEQGIYLSARNLAKSKEIELEKNWLSPAKRAPACGAPDNVRCLGWPGDKLIALGKKQWRRV